MTFATIGSCVASKLSAGGVSAGAPVSAAASAVLASIERAVDLARFVFEQSGCGCASIPCAARRNQRPTHTMPAPRRSARQTPPRPAGVELERLDLLPAQEYRVAAQVQAREMLLPFCEASRSPMRPPQPYMAPSGADACQTDCWSLCENSFAGSGHRLRVKAGRCGRHESAGRRWQRPRTAAASNRVASGASASAIRKLQSARQRVVGISGVSSVAWSHASPLPRRLIFRVIRRVERHDGVVPIVAAVQEHADQRFVAACDLRGSGANRSEV